MRKLAIAVLAFCLPLLAKAPLHEVQLTTTDHADLAPGGTIRVSGSYGQLDVEGWDRPQVEVTVTRSVWRSDTAQGRERGTQLLKQVVVKIERKAAGEVAISTVLPSWNLITRPLRDRTEVSLQYAIKVPHDAHLVIHQESGDVRLEGMTAALEATLHSGDIELRLPEASPYTIDAKCRIGGVYSDFTGDHRVHYAVGERFDHQAASSAPHAVLRVDAGGIQILKIPAIATAP